MAIAVGDLARITWKGNWENHFAPDFGDKVTDVFIKRHSPHWGCVHGLVVEVVAKHYSFLLARIEDGVEIALGSYYFSPLSPIELLALAAEGK